MRIQLPLGLTRLPIGVRRARTASVHDDYTRALNHATRKFICRQHVSLIARREVRDMCVARADVDSKAAY